MVLLAVGEEHVDRLIDQSGPTIPSGIVGDLLVDQSRDQRGPQIEVPCFGDPIQGQQLLGVGQETDCRRIRLWRWLEAGDGPLEQQLVPRRVLGAELDEGPSAPVQGRNGVAGFGAVLEASEELSVGLGEHGVVDGVLGGEVHVQGLGPHAYPGAEPSDGEGGHALLAHELPGRGEDLVDRRLTPLGPPVTYKYT